MLNENKPLNRPFRNFILNNQNYDSNFQYLLAKTLEVNLSKQEF